MAKVLLVEDDNNLREIYEARLQAEGYEISSAQDGEEALVVAKQFKPDLIISDVMMPKISGFEMLDILRNTEGLEHTRVIMLTALGQAEDKTRADSLGADRYLVKSQVTLEDIVKSAHEILDGDAAVPAPVGDSTTVSAATAPANDAAATPTAPAVPTEAAAVAPEPPVAATATEEPAPEPAPETPRATSPGAAAEPGTAANEQATVDQQIQDFIKNAPAETPVAEPAATDDALLSEAADSLATEAPEKTPAAEPVAVEPPPATEAAADAPAEEPKAAPTNDNVTIAHKKVIEPPAESGKPSLDELLAKEEARESGLPVAPVSSTPVAATPVEAEDFKLPEGASEDSSPVPEPVAVEPPPAPEPEPAAEAPAAPSVEPAPAAAAEPAPAPETPAAAPSAPGEPKKPTDFDPHSVAL